MLDGNGRLQASIGVGGQKTLLSEQRWVDLFDAAGLPARLENDMPLWLRCHVPLCVAFESVSVADERRGDGASWEEAVVLARGDYAGVGLIRSLGYEIHPNGKKRIYALPVGALAAMLWVLSRIRQFREVLATGTVECQALVDDMIEAAPRAMQPVKLSYIQAMRPS